MAALSMTIAICPACAKQFNARPSKLKSLKSGRKACSWACRCVLMRSHRTAREAFDLHVIRSSDPDACWGWNGPTSSGYGSVSFSKGERSGNDGAHRVSYRLSIGPIPPGMFVCHTCDNRVCSNPAHLFLGTHKDNMRDMVAKGRRAQSPRLPGETNPRAKLSRIDVMAIRASPEDARALAKNYGVVRETIYAIRKGETWK